MDTLPLLAAAVAVAPAALMVAAGLGAHLSRHRPDAAWAAFRSLSGAASLIALLALAATLLDHGLPGIAGVPLAIAGLAPTMLAVWMAALVQLLGTVVGLFSSRYLQGEPRQPRYVGALAGVLASVHLLLLANHWLLLITAWAIAGMALQRLLCFYDERPWALLAAHKKRLADRLADVLLLASAALAWRAVGSGSLSELWAHVDHVGVSPALQWSAAGLVLAVVLRTALLPVHGWLTQVMEAPTPVSALLHAGVVNLGGFILIRFAPLLDHAPAARALLVVFGLSTAVLAGLVMLTRISIKVRLAWSTIAQMGFMVLECGLGLYTLAALHLIGHSLYKAHTFLASASVVRQRKQQMMHATASPAGWSLVAAPLFALLAVLAVQLPSAGTTWPWWWSALLAVAWAPMLWVPQRHDHRAPGAPSHLVAGLAMVLTLALAARMVHVLPLGVTDSPQHAAGVATLLGMAVMYLCLATIAWRPRALSTWRRWSYAGFYLDEFYTRLALQLWPARWAQAGAGSFSPALLSVLPAPAAE